PDHPPPHSFPTRRSSDLVPAPTGSGRRDRGAPSTVVTDIPPSTSHTRTPRPTPPGREKNCRPRPSGSWRLVGGSRQRSSPGATRSEEHTSELQSRSDLVC